jgi:hypothetical protein
MIASICTAKMCPVGFTPDRIYWLLRLFPLRVRDETAGGRLRRAHAHNFLERDFGARLLLARVLGC